MKKTLILFFCVMLPLILLAKREAEPVIAIMADGTRIQGYTKSYLINYLKPDVSNVSISKDGR